MASRLLTFAFLLPLAAAAEVAGLLAPASLFATPAVRVAWLLLMVCGGLFWASQERRKASARLRHLHDLARGVRAPLNGATPLEPFCHRVRELTHAAAVVVQVVETGGNLRTAGSVGAFPGWVTEHLLTPLERHPLLRARLLTEARSLSPEEATYLQGILPGQPVAAAFGLPVREGGELRAVLLVAYARPVRFSPDDVECLRLIITSLGAMLAHASSMRSLLEEARTDPLTGLGSRRMFEDHYVRCVARAERGQHRLSLVMLDVDGLKEINDRYGHRTGDEVLRMVGRLLRDLREGDVAARYGGDEFVLLLPDTDRAQAEHAMNRFRERLARFNGLGVFPFPLRLSIGIREVQPDDKDSLALVDAAMYREKRSHQSRERRNYTKDLLQELDLEDLTLPAVSAGR